MSDKQAEASAVDPQQAYDVLFGNVHMPVFFEKLAQDYGVVPQNEQEAQQLLEMGAKLRVAHSEELVKSGSHENSFLGAANSHLDETLGAAGVDDAAAQEGAIMEVSAALAQDPTLQQAVLSYQDAVAQSLVDQEAAQYEGCE